MSSHVVYGHVCVNTHLPGGQRGDWESFFVILFVILLLNLDLVGGQQTPVILLSQPQIVLELQSLGSPIPAFFWGEGLRSKLKSLCLLIMPSLQVTTFETHLHETQSSLKFNV